MRKTIAVILLIMLFALTGCSPVSNGDINYIRTFVSGNVDFSIDLITVTEYEKAAKVNVETSVVKPEEFGAFTEQAAKAIVQAAQEKNVPIRSIDVSIIDSEKNRVLNWSSNDGETGSFVDYRGEKIVIINTVKTEEVQDLVDLNTSEKASLLETIVTQNKEYQVNGLVVSSMPSDHKKMFVIATIIIPRGETAILENFREHSKNTADFIWETAAANDTAVGMICVKADNEAGDNIKMENFALPSETQSGTSPENDEKSVDYTQSNLHSYLLSNSDYAFTSPTVSKNPDGSYSATIDCIIDQTFLERIQDEFDRYVADGANVLLGAAEKYSAVISDATISISDKDENPILTWATKDFEKGTLTDYRNPIKVTYEDVPLESIREIIYPETADN